MKYSAYLFSGKCYEKKTQQLMPGRKPIEQLPRTPLPGERSQPGALCNAQPLLRDNLSTSHSQSPNFDLYDHHSKIPDYLHYTVRHVPLNEFSILCNPELIPSLLTHKVTSTALNVVLGCLAPALVSAFISIPAAQKQDQVSQHDRSPGIYITNEKQSTNRKAEHKARPDLGGGGWERVRERSTLRPMEMF